MHVLTKMALGVSVGLIAATSATASLRSAGSSLSDLVTYEFQQGLTGYTSARNMTNQRFDPTGQDYTLAVLAQNTSSAFFIDTLPDDYTFGIGPHANGKENVITGAGIVAHGFRTGNVYSVAVFSDDGSQFLPAGVDPGNGDPLTALRIDLGMIAAGPGPIPLSPGFNVLGVEVILFVDGTAVFSTSTLAASDYSAGLAAVSVIGGVAGSGVDEWQIHWTLDVPTPGTAALFGLAGVVAIRRRR